MLWIWTGFPGLLSTTFLPASYILLALCVRVYIRSTGLKWWAPWKEQCPSQYLPNTRALKVTIERINDSCKNYFNKKISYCDSDFTEYWLTDCLLIRHYDFFSSTVRSHNLKVSGFSCIHPLLYALFLDSNLLSRGHRISSPFYVTLPHTLLSSPHLKDMSRVTGQRNKRVCLIYLLLLANGQIKLQCKWILAYGIVLEH